MLVLPPVYVSAFSEIHFYIGTYTAPDGSKGIYRAGLNRKTGKISTPKLSILAENPSYVALHPNGHFLYAVHENDLGSVSAYSVGRRHSLKLINTQKVPGGAPCHLSVDPTGRHLLVASYTGGYITDLPIMSHGRLGEAGTVVHHTGGGPNKDRQEAAHAHFAGIDYRGKYAYSCDLGTDKVQTYSLGKPGKMTLLDKASSSVAPGDGPRHGAFSLNHRFLYVNGEMENTVTVFKVNRSTGGLKPLQSISTIPKDFPVNKTATAEIQCHPTGKWIYVSNRGHDSIAVFRVHRNGHLKLVEIKKLPVHEPRGFQIEPSGRWLVVGGQKSNDIASLKIDRRTGKLLSVGSKVALAKPVCILFE